MAPSTSQFAALERIAEFSARLRGHQLSAWQSGTGSATAACSKCGRAITVYASLLQPEMDGTVLSADCGEPLPGEET